MGLLGFLCSRILRVGSSGVPSTEHLCGWGAGCGRRVITRPLHSPLSPLPPQLLTSFFPSLFPVLSLSLDLVTLSCAHESVNSLKAWTQSVLRNSSVSHSLGKRGGGSLCSLAEGRSPFCAWRTGRSGQGSLEKLRTLCLEQFWTLWTEGSPQTEGLCGPLRASAALLSNW